MVLMCNLGGEVMWSRQDDEELPEGYRVDGNELRIPNPQTEDSGVYVCTAEGGATATFQLTVTLTTTESGKSDLGLSLQMGQSVVPDVTGIDVGLLSNGIFCCFSVSDDGGGGGIDILIIIIVAAVGGVSLAIFLIVVTVAVCYFCRRRTPGKKYSE